MTAQQLRQEQDAVATYDESTASHLSALLKAPFVVNTSDHSLLSHGDCRVNRAALPSVSASFFTTDGVQKPSTSGALDSCALRCAGTLCFCLGHQAIGDSCATLPRRVYSCGAPCSGWRCVHTAPWHLICIFIWHTSVDACVDMWTFGQQQSSSQGNASSPALDINWPGGRTLTMCLYCCCRQGQRRHAQGGLVRR